jgi:hypothetical protein
MANKLAKTNQYNRSGSVHYRIDAHAGGQTALSLSVDFDRAPVPDHSYVADFVEVSREQADVLIVFGKIDLPSRKALRNKIELYFPFVPFVHQLWRSSRKFHEGLKQAITQKGHVVTVPNAISSETSKVQSFVTNACLMAQANGQCMLDFFLINPKDLWLKTRKGDALNLDALVRVFMNDYLIVELLDRCDEIAQALVTELEITFPENEDEIVESVQL